MLILVVVVLAAVALIPSLVDTAGRIITARFGTAIGVYPGSDVRVLGVKVGSLQSVEPEGSQVKVVMKVNNDVDIPGDARAVVIAPNLVSDRYVQLLPAYNGGAKMPAGSTIDVSRTATPMELDQLYDSIRRFTSDLGPDGVNARGALSELIRTGAANLDGNGKLLNSTIADMGKASQTLADSSEDLYGTVSNLNRFSVMLRANDGQIRQIERQLASVTEFLAADRDELTAGLHELGIALIKARDFLRKYRGRLKGNVDQLAKLTQLLVDQRASLAEALDNTPVLVGNVLNAYDPASRSLMSRGNLLEITKAFGSKSQAGVDATAADARPVCAAASAATPALAAECERLNINGLTVVPPSQAGSVPPLPFPTAGPLYGGTERGDG